MEKGAIPQLTRIVNNIGFFIFSYLYHLCKFNFEHDGIHHQKQDYCNWN